MSLRALFASVALLLVASAPLAAEIVILGGGDLLKVTAFEVVGERIRLELPSGGELVLSLRRVDRIVADEIVDDPPPASVALRLGFDTADPVPDGRYGELIYEAGRRHGVNPAVIVAVIGVESGFDPRAVSRKGARGLMQLMPATGERFGVAFNELLDPERNLDGGTQYLRWLAERFEGDATRVFAAYNAGEGAVDRYAGVPPYRETRDYIDRVLGRLGVEPGGSR